MGNQFVVKVFFRGDWCPWCNAYLRDFDEHAFDRVRHLGGVIVGITSQIGNESKKNNNLRFDIIIDEENEEAKKYNIFVTPKEKTPLKDVDQVYRFGMVQPGVVIEDSSGTILYRWAINPDEMNFGGATDRPLVRDIVEALSGIFDGSEDGNAFNKTDMEYLKNHHPEQHKIVLEYLAGMEG